MDSTTNPTGINLEVLRTALDLTWEEFVAAAEVQPKSVLLQAYVSTIVADKTLARLAYVDTRIHIHRFKILLLHFWI